jgi:rRNA maturation protein Nop10
VSDTLTGKHVLSGDEPDDTTAAAPAPLFADDQPTATSTGPLAPPLAVPAPTAAPEERVTCPECGTVAMVALTRRESNDFCVQCDYPLFWTPSKIVLDTGDTSGDSLRRLPGTSGRVMVGSVPCPHCAEGNLLTAEVCARCGGLMVVPTPAPVVAAPPPPPAPEPEPKQPIPWWIWAVGGITLLLLIALIVYFVR